MQQRLLDQIGRIHLRLQTPVGADLGQQEDVMFQFDAIGNDLQFWAWRPGEAMPSEPQLSAVDDALTEGVPYIGWGIGTVDNPGPGIFRFVQLATTPIPEPSSAAMVGLALAILSVFARRPGVRS